MGRWMIVEDEPDLYDMLLTMTDLMGVDGVAFANGEDAVAWIEDVEEKRLSADLPDLALLDMRLPGEINGEDVGARLRESPVLGEITVVLMTAYRLSPKDEKAIFESFRRGDADLQAAAAPRRVHGADENRHGQTQAPQPAQTPPAAAGAADGMSHTNSLEQVDIAVVGAGAAGLMAAIQAARAAPAARVIALDGARTLGAKILVSGGGRCNVTHDVVDSSAYAGSSRNAIGKILRQFDVPATIAFFEDLGVPLKSEDTGKLFPVSNRARTVLDALVGAARDCGVGLRHPRRVESIARTGSSFMMAGGWGSLHAQRVVLATGGKSLPKTGSDGGGYALAQALGHTLTPRVFPALVPLLLPREHFLRDLSGVSIDAILSVHSATGKRLYALAGAVLFTHFGLSGPGVLDISRYWLDARANDAGASLVMNALPGIAPETLDADLRALGRSTPLNYLSRRLPDRLARALVAEARLDPAMPASQLPRDSRRALVNAVTALCLPVTGDRGYTYAEVTAGGVPLSELQPDTLKSRTCAGLYLCGEICDVDGRIGGYNFQWAWASGFVAGRAAGRANAGVDR